MSTLFRREIREIARCRRGAAAIEFALIAMAFLPLCLGIMEGGLLLSTRNGLQITANITARCVAISSPACSNAAQYAVTTAGKWLPANVLTTAGVTVQTGASCGGSTGNMVKVTLSSGGFTAIPIVSNLSMSSLTAVGCYPASP